MYTTSRRPGHQILDDHRLRPPLIVLTKCYTVERGYIELEWNREIVRYINNAIYKIKILFKILKGILQLLVISDDSLYPGSRYPGSTELVLLGAKVRPIESLNFWLTVLTIYTSFLHPPLQRGNITRYLVGNDRLWQVTKSRVKRDGRGL